MTVRFRTFRKHRRPCGQPAVVGEIGRFRPVPPHAGHFIRINATPSDFPFKSTGFATYPEPPQFGQSSGATPSPPRVTEDCRPEAGVFAKDRITLRIPNKPPKPRSERPIQRGFVCKDRVDRTKMCLLCRFHRLVRGIDLRVQFERAGQTCSLKILSIRIHFSPGFACGRAFWNLTSGSPTPAPSDCGDRLQSWLRKRSLR